MENQDVNAQLKAEIDGAELTKVQRYALQQKYGLAPVTETEIDWYLAVIGKDLQ